jgi:NADPH:quinone reductase-like Zn-dependent oxidoreductase
MTRTMDLARKGTLKPVMNPKGPFPFTTEGVRDAFHVQESRHTQGKVVVHVADCK